MQESELKELKNQLKTLKDVSKCYSGKTVENIIQQIQSRVDVVVNSSYKLKIQDLIENKMEKLDGENHSNPEYTVLLHLTDFLSKVNSDDVVLAKLRMMEDGFPYHAVVFGKYNNSKPDKSELDRLSKTIAKECIEYLNVK